jgi:chromosome segregation ATPase
MKKLGVGQRKDWQKLISDARDAQSELEADIALYNTAIEEAKGNLEPAITKMNEALEAARQFRDSIVEQMDEYVSNRSDKWQEGDAASEYESWKQEWENLELEDFEFEFPEAQEPELPWVEAMDVMPEEMS